MIPAKYEAQRRGSDWQAQVWPEYRISDGVLRKAGFVDPPRFVISSYYPMAHPELPVEVAKLRTGDEEALPNGRYRVRGPLGPLVGKVRPGDEDAVLRFARRWGLLGHDQLVPTLAQWWDDRGQLQTGYPDHLKMGGDPLRWIWAHAETVRRCLMLISLLDTGTEMQTRDFLSKMSRPAFRLSPNREQGTIYPYAADLDLEAIVVIQGRDLSDHRWDLDVPKTAKEEAATVLAEMISMNLGGIVPLFMYDRFEQPPVLARRWVVPSLLSAVYWHLSDAALGFQAYIICDYCGSWFQRNHGLQRYCPNPLGADQQSLCSLNHRQRRLRSRKRASRDDATNFAEWVGGPAGL